MRFRCTSIQVKAGLPKTGILHTEQAKTDYVTIAHQDDIYEPNYLKMIFGELKKGKDPIVVFTDYGELRDGEKVQKSTLLTIKRILLLPMRVQGFQNVRFFKRLFLRFGNPVCCPATTYIRKKFKGEFRLK